MSALSRALCLVVLLALPAHATVPYAPFTYTDPNGAGSMPYQLLIPPKWDKKSPVPNFPVIIFFHGVGERGTDGKAQLAHCSEIFSDDAFQAAHPCFVVFPQCPGDDTWAGMDWSQPSSKRPAQPTKSMTLALKILDDLEKKYPINKDQEFACGLSMGGFATWDCVTRHPDRFAAAAAACGGGDETTITPAVAAVPVWAFASSDDPVISVVRSRNMVATMNKLGGHVRYTEYNWCGHYCWDQGFHEYGLWDWLFNFSLASRPKTPPTPPAVR